MATTISVNAIQVNRGAIASSATGNPYVVVVDDIIGLQTFTGGYNQTAPDARINTLITTRGYGQNAGNTILCSDTLSAILSLLAAATPQLPAMTVIAQAYGTTTPITVSAFQTLVTETLTGATTVTLTTPATILAGSMITFAWTATGSNRTVTYTTGFTTSGRTVVVATGAVRNETFIYNGSTWSLLSSITNANIT